MKHTQHYRTALIVGNTSRFHLGSYLNCKNLESLIRRRYELIGFVGGKKFKFTSYASFLEFIATSSIFAKIKKAEVIFFHGEGFMEPGSTYGKALFYLARYVRNNWGQKKLYLINFSCYESNYGDWNLFDRIIPRDVGTYQMLKSRTDKLMLGFDCLVNENSDAGMKIPPALKRNIIVFRGRKQITLDQLRLLKGKFADYNLVPVSGFWKFKYSSSLIATSPKQIFKIMRNAFLVVSSSFHGIILSSLFCVPFIPLPTIPITKNESVSRDILGNYFRSGGLEEWISFYLNRKNYIAVEKHLRKTLPRLRRRTLNYIK